MHVACQRGWIAARGLQENVNFASAPAVSRAAHGRRDNVQHSRVEPVLRDVPFHGKCALSTSHDLHAAVGAGARLSARATLTGPRMPAARVRQSPVTDAIIVGGGRDNALAGCPWRLARCRATRQDAEGRDTGREQSRPRT